MSEIHNTRVYELGYLLLPTLTDADKDAAVEAMIEAITAASGSVLSQSDAEAMQLAYTMEKVIDNKKTPFESAYFGWIKFEAVSTNVETIKDTVEAMPSMLRALLVQTLKDDALTNKRPAATLMEDAEDLAKEASKEDEKPAEASEETEDDRLDKNIDKLVEEVTNADDDQTDA